MTQEQIAEIVRRVLKHNYCDSRGLPISAEEQISKEILKLHQEEEEQEKNKYAIRINIKENE